MSYYNDPTWPAPAPGRQSSWEQPQPPSRSGTGNSVSSRGRTLSNMGIGASSTVNRDEANAFVSQFDGTLPWVRGPRTSAPCWAAGSRSTWQWQALWDEMGIRLTHTLQKSNVPPRTSPRAESHSADTLHPRPRLAVAVASRCPQ